jgi:hypothetical protein
MPWSRRSRCESRKKRAASEWRCWSKRLRPGVEQHPVEVLGVDRNRARLRDQLVEERRRDLEATLPLHHLRERQLVEEDGARILHQLGERDRRGRGLARLVQAPRDSQQRSRFREHREEASRLGSRRGDLVHLRIHRAREGHGSSGTSRSRASRCQASAPEAGAMPRFGAMDCILRLQSAPPACERFHISRWERVLPWPALFTGRTRKCIDSSQEGASSPPLQP